MAVFLSPGVITNEVDATAYTQEISGKTAGFVGTFMWGPASEPTYIAGDADYLAKIFGKSSNTYYKSVMPCVDYLSYVKSMYVVRLVGASARNAFPSTFTPKLVRNKSEYEAGTFTNVNFFGRYPGTYVNGLQIDVVDSTTHAAWEFKNKTKYAPKNGEYTIGVIDTTGNIYGNGAIKQIERLSVRGDNAVGGVQQIQSLAITGTSATGGTQQQETLTFSGSATATTTISVNGVSVSLTAGDDSNTVATKVAAALAAVVATYQSAVAIANIVQVTFKVPTSNQTAIAAGSSNGVTWGSVIITAGDANYVMSLYGENIPLTYGDTPTTVATKIYNVIGLKTDTYTAVSKPSATSVQFTYVAYGSATLGVVTTSGITVTPTVSTPGSSTITLSVFGVSVSILNGDTGPQVATKIAGTAGIIALFNRVWASNGNVFYELKTAGIATKQTTPVDQGGLTFSVYVDTYGSKGELLEMYELVNNVRGDTFEDGSPKFWFDAVKQSSKMIYPGDSNTALVAGTTVLVGGVDDNNVVINSGYDLLKNKEKYSIQYFPAGIVTVAEQQYIIDIAETRGNSMAIVAPMFSDVVNNAGGEMADVDAWRQNEIGRDSTYAFAVDNWGYIYDKWSNTYRWIPATAGTAGIFGKNAIEKDPWIPPAGEVKGKYKNYSKLAWYPNQDERDVLYPHSVNSITEFDGGGPVLFGDKTMTNVPTAFDRYNVRWAFIVAKDSLAKMARRFLFELNNEFTRAQFVNAARPFLRNMTNRDAFEDFKVICDEKINDGSVRAEHKMIAKIMLKPQYSINWVVLDLMAVRPDVEFSVYIQ